MNMACCVEPWQMPWDGSPCLSSGGTGLSVVLVVLGVREPKSDSWLSVLPDEESDASCLLGM